MELAARLHSSHSPYLSVKPFFSDQSHLVFYGPSSSTQCKPIIPLLHTKFAASASPPLASLRTTQPPLHSSFCASSAFDTVSSIPSELDLLKELSVLKAQVKLKKKQLKALAKEKKAEPERKKMKSKGGSSSSSSSSSSESSDGGSMAVNMRLLKKDLKQGVSVSGELHRLPVDVDHTEYRNEGIIQSVPSRCESHELYARAERAYSQRTRSPNHPVQDFRDEAIAAQSFQDDPSHGALAALATGHARAISGSIEVCMGGKCKKSGSEQLLSAFKAHIPASACVDAVPCKCMGKCGSTINVKVQKEDTNPQHHSHVSVDDAGLILSHHFGLGPPLSGLPCFSSLSPSSTPSIFTAQV